MAEDKEESSAILLKEEDQAESGSIKSYSMKSSRSAHSSNSSRVSRSSHASRVSVAAAKARAEAKAAQAKIAYAQQEMELKLEKVRLEAKLDILQQQKEASVALVKAEVMEAAAAEFKGDERPGNIEAISLQTSAQQKVREYIAQQASVNLTETNLDQKLFIRPEIAKEKSNSGNFEETPVHRGSHSQQFCSLPQSDNAYRPRVITQQYSPLSYREQSTTTELARFLARSQLVTGGMRKYDDRPENYLSWRSTFLSAIEGLGLTANEEADLLIKWLGPESSEQARRIKAVNIRNPATGLNMIWSRLEECYGAPEAIERALFAKVENFPKLSSRDHGKLRELGDLLMELESAKNEDYLPGLSYLDTARGVAIIVEKLPFHLQERWMSIGSKYKEDHRVAFPPFSLFADFIRREARARNDPSFNTNILTTLPAKKDRFGGNNRAPISVHKTFVSTETRKTNKALGDPEKECPIHNKPHPLRKCRGFRTMSLDDRRKLLKDNAICFRCCASNEHQAKNCEATVECAECNSQRHISAMHPGTVVQSTKPTFPLKEHGGEEEATSQDITTKCTEVCGAGFRGKSCSKICLVDVYPTGQPDKIKRMYVILDDQSNRSLAKSEFFQIFNITGTTSPYTLKTCAGTTEAVGRRAYGYTVESIDGKVDIPLPVLIECNDVPNNREEIPTPEVALHQKHLRFIANQIPPVDSKAEILLLLGRDVMRVHKVRKQLNGPHNAPYAQRLDLGWVIVGDVCLGKMHKPNELSTLKTCILENGRPTNFAPCDGLLRVKEDYSSGGQQRLKLESSLKTTTVKKTSQEKLGGTVFCQTANDNQLALSIEDRKFVEIMEKGFVKDSYNNWVAPLPFRCPRRLLPNNKDYALKRLMSLKRTLDKKPEMKAQYIEFMQKLFDNNHAEPAPLLQEGRECWYLPTFGVYHPKKLDQIRVVFDSSAQTDRVSLNDVLLSGPNLNNSLVGVLIRFRKDPVAVTADIQQMFYSFIVQEEDRDFLRFLWFHDNDLNNEIVDFRMRVHVFGNSPSPAVAIFGLRKAARDAESQYGSDVRQFIERDFYVDDALKSFTTEAEAIDVLQRARKALALSNIKLHKVASNRTKVMDSIPAEDRAKTIKDLDLASDELPLQHSLGLGWDIMEDAFVFQVPEHKKPFTRRGVLSTVSSLFDPLGFLAPATIQGRLLLRELTCQESEWDSPLPEGMYKDWKRWLQSLQELEKVKVPRTYGSFSTSQAQSRELHVFSDASVKAIAAVAYLKTVQENGHSETGFVFGKTKLAPLPALTIPRLELCAAVLGVEIADFIVDQLDLKLDKIKFYTDSKVVLGYIHNESRRFYVYVHNRVQRIRQSSSPDQWSYVSTDNNPADHGSRGTSAGQLLHTTWISGPTFLLKPEVLQEHPLTFELISPESDVEVRPTVTILTTQVTSLLGSTRFERFSRWSTVIKTVARLQHISRSFKKPRRDNDCDGWHVCKQSLTEKDQTQAERAVIRCVQREMYAEEYKSIEAKKDLPTNSPLQKLNPIIDQNGLLRVGGRITKSELHQNEANPILMPGKHHLTTLLICHHHEKVMHQGRHFTEGAIRASGFWIIGAKRCISSVINKCVICRKLRRKVEHQKMADLPQERLHMDPPFSYVGLDVFGPWEVAARRTRGNQACSKRWAVLFTCMSTRAVHIEVIDSMSSSTFINALRRFFSLRGPAKQLRSDCGTNFVGASRELKLTPPSLGEKSVESYLQDQRCTWVFNPPHASHMGGVWERMIGTTRRILDSMFMQLGKSSLTHEILTTLMAEVVAIINARPLIPLSSDPEAPLLLTPATLLTQKVGVPPLPPIDITKEDLFKQHWKRVQVLAETFWAKWRKEFLSTLQTRQTWLKKIPNLKEGDVVLMKDTQTRRNEWPLGVITKVFPSDDGLVRKVEVKVSQHQTVKTILRPVSAVVLLISNNEETCEL